MFRGKEKPKKQRKPKRIFISCVALLLALILAVQGKEQIFVWLQEVATSFNLPIDFLRPDALGSLDDAGIKDNQGVNDDEIDYDNSGNENGAEKPKEYYPIPSGLEELGEVAEDAVLVHYDEYSKTYAIGKEDYVTVFGGYVGTYINADGKVCLVDNTLIDSKLQNRSNGKSEAVANKANDYLVTFPREITTDNGMTVIKGDYYMEIIPLKGDYSDSVVAENAILYKDVYEGIDVQYTVIDKLIKEDIVLNQRSDKTIFTYELYIPDMEASIEDNIVYVYPKGTSKDDVIYILDAPYMQDDNGEYCYNVALSLSEENGKTILTVTPDEEWLQDENRAYPVRIDPSTIVAEEITGNTINMYGVEENSPDIYTNDICHLYLGYDDGIASGNKELSNKYHGNCRIYLDINYDFGLIPQDASIENATFSVSQRYAYGDGSAQFELCYVEESWNGPDLTWYEKPYNFTHVDTQNAKTDPNVYINYNATDVVNAWIKGTLANNGLLLKGVREPGQPQSSADYEQCEVLNSCVFGPQIPKITIEWSSAADPFLKDYPMDDTTVVLRPITEQNKSGLQTFYGVFVDGLAQCGSDITYYLLENGKQVGTTLATGAENERIYPDSTFLNKLFPNATKYLANYSNWQSEAFFGLRTDTLYQIKARASKTIDGKLVIGKQVASDTFLIYEVKSFDTLPKIAQYYGVDLNQLMKDNQVQDILAMEGNTLFIRNPKTTVAYTPDELSDRDKSLIDGALMGRGEHCEFDFEPINLNTGNFYMEQTDVSINELGGAFAINRSYNSLSAGSNSMFGRGWSFAYDQILSQTAEGNILYKRADGSYLIFTKNADGTYSAPTGYIYELKKISYTVTKEDKSTKTEYRFELTDADKSIYKFDKYGMLTSVTSVDGFVTSLSYDENYNLSQITTASGKVFQITQNIQGYITKIILPDANAISYGYDSNGNLISVTNPNGNKRTYQYDSNHLMTSWADENGNTVITNVYDNEGRVTKQTDANGGVATLTYGENTTTTVDNEGNKTVYKYDDNKRTIAITYPDGSYCYKSYNDSNQLVKEVTPKGTRIYTYDVYGNIATETREDGAKATYTYNEQNKLTNVIGYAGGVVTNIYDANGNLVTCIQPDGNKVTYTYDNLHRMTSQTDGRGVTITYTYEGANLVSYIDGEGNKWSFTYDKLNRQISASDPLGNTSQIVYDAVGNKIAQVAADGGKTTYTLDALGNILSTKDAKGNVTSFTYDKMYNILTVTDADGSVIKYEYNKNGDKIKATDANGDSITYTLDCMGRVVKETNKDFGTKTYTYDLAGNITKIQDGEGSVTVSEYNSEGLVTKTTDALGNVTCYEYDALGNTTKVIYADGSYETKEYDAIGRLIKETDELGVVTTYTYDANSNLLSLTDDSGRTYSYVYDSNNNKIQETNPAGGVSTYTYDVAGRMTSYTNENGQKEAYTLDAMGRVLTVTDAAGNVTVNTYDLMGNVTSRTDALGNTTTYTYDAFNNLTSITDALGNITAMKYDKTGHLTETMDALKGVSTYEYDSRGNLIKMTDALGKEYLYTYDKNGNNTSITGEEDTKTIMKYDAIGQMIEKTDSFGLTTTYRYNAVGQLIEEADNAGNCITYTYDGAGNVTSKTDQTGRTTTYTYDKYGRLIEEVTPDQSTTTYAYDVMDRVVTVTDAEGTTTTTTYDAVGNQISITEADGATTTFVYDALNRVTSTTDPLGGTETYQYDALGNVVTHTDKKGIVICYTYDANKNLLSVTDGNGGITTYEYDELQRLIKETSPEGEEKEYRYDALGNLIRYKDALGLITQYEYDVFGNMVKTISPKGAKITYTYDKHGNVLTETDAKGAVTTYTYDFNDQVTTLTQANGGVYTYAYDEVGRLEKVTSPLGFWTSFTYDLVDNVIEETNSLGQTTKYTYDRLHRLLTSTNVNGAITQFAYDIRNNLISETNALGNTTSYTYDVLGRLVEEKNPLGQATTYAYDPVGNLESMLTPGGAKTTYTYDGNYNVVEATDPLGNVTSYAYDKSNRITGTTDALKQTASVSYDANGQVIAETDKAGNTKGYTYDAHGNVITITGKLGLNTHYAYDDNGNLTKVTDNAGNITTYEYDIMGNLTAYISALGKATTYTYDLEGNQTSITDASGRKESYTYDEAGRLTSKISAGGNVTTYDYDALNQLIEKAYANASGEQKEESVLYGYNALGQRVSMTDTIGDASYEYDALGRITGVKDSAGEKVTYTYDEAGNLASIGYSDGTSVNYGYDLNGNLTSVTDRDGAITRYEYDGLNRMVATIRPNYVNTYVTYDALDHIEKLTTINVITGRTLSTYEYTYNEEGYVVSETATEAVVSELFEESFELFLDEVLFKNVSYEDTVGLQKLWKHFYDALHILCDHNDADGDGNPDNCLYGHLTVTTESTYIYDENYQLTKCIEVGEYKGTTTYEYWYDEDGNRTKYVKAYDGQTLECYTYAYNTSNQLVSRTNERLWSDNVTYYTYDADGNMISEKTGCIEKTYEYTAESRLSVVRLQGQVLMAALYDGDGNKLFSMDYTGDCDNLCGHEGCSMEECIFHSIFEGDAEVWIPDCGDASENARTNAVDAMKELASLVSRRAHDDYTITQYVNNVNCENEQVLQELNLFGRTTKAYIYGNNRLAYDTGEDISYYLYDGLGSVSRIATEWGRIKETYDYDPYGNLTFGLPDSVNYYGYNGESQSLTTGLQYLRARYYQTENGRFISEDSYLGTQSEPLTRNRYAYVSNNPLNFIDPSGHFLEKIGKKLFDYAMDAVDSIFSYIGDKVSELVDYVATPDVQKSLKKTAQKTLSKTTEVLNKLNIEGTDTILSQPEITEEDVIDVAEDVSDTVKEGFCYVADEGLAFWADDGMDGFRKILHDIDAWDEKYKKALENVMDGVNVVGSATGGHVIIRPITSNNDVEERLFSSFEDIISRYLAFEYNAEEDYYYTNENYGIQRISGFHDSIDWFDGLLGMDLDTKIIEYEVGNVNYRLQLWKGSYGYGNAYGSEINLYYNTDDDETWYAPVEGEQEIRTEQNLYLKGTNELLIHNDVATYTDDGKHFWNLAIRTDAGYTKEDLWQESILYIEDKAHKDALVEKLNKEKMKYGLEEYGDDKYKISIIF